MRRRLLVGLLLLGACSTHHVYKGHAPLDEDGELTADLALARDATFTSPRRYPFTVAVAPLYLDWPPEDTTPLHGETLPSQLPLDDPARYPPSQGYPAGSDPPEEEEAIRRALSRGRDAGNGAPASGAAGNGAPGNGAPGSGDGATPPAQAPGGEAQETPPPAEGHEGHEPGPDSQGTSGPGCPPEEGEEAAPEEGTSAEQPASLSYTVPEGWVEAAPVVSTALLRAHAAPVGSDGIAGGCVQVTWEPLVAHLLPGTPLPRTPERAQALMAELQSSAPAAEVGDAAWREVDGYPAIEVQGLLPDGRLVVLQRVFTAQRVFTLRLETTAGEEDLGEQLLGSVQVEGPALPDREQLTRKEQARRAELDALRGKNFPVDEVGYRDRTVALLERFGLFERVVPLTITQDSQRRDPLALLPEADRLGADLMLVAHLRRNKTSYLGVSGVGRFLLDFGAWLAFWWPSEIWPGIASEHWRSDVELQVELVDVRSRAVLWSKTYSHDETLSLTQPDRGWVPWGVLLVRMGLLTDGMLSGAQEHVGPPTWLDVEYQLLRDLWSPDGFKGVIDTQGFEDRVNRDVTARRVSLVAAVGRYGPQAAPVLARLAEEAARARGSDLAALRAEYRDEALEWGVRPYAEKDAERLGSFLHERAAFDRDRSPVLTGAQASRVAIKAALRQLAKARRGDPSFLYLAGETVVADDPSQPGDQLRKYLLPWDADLEGLERIMAEAPPAERRERVLAHLERTAISFQWIEATLDRTGLEDHRYQQSRQSMLVIDAPFPGTTGLRYAPEYAARQGLLGSGQDDGPGPGERGPGQAPGGGGEGAPGQGGQGSPGQGGGSAPGQEPPGDRPPGDGDRPPPEEPPPADAPPNQPPSAPPPPEEGEPQRKPTRVRRVAGAGGPPLETSTLPAGEEQRRGPRGRSALTPQFLEALAARPGRLVVVTARFGEPLLDVIPQRQGGFVYHFLRGAEANDRVPLVDGGKTARAVLDYARARIEDESRILNRPQSLLVLGDGLDFPLLVEGR